MKNPFTLPSGNVLIAFSGGRTSAFMLNQIMEANGGLPDRVIVSFQNTGAEKNETLDFVQECAHRWGFKIVWLEYRANPAPKKGETDTRFEVVNHNSASRNKEPFTALIRKRKMLPFQMARFCTAELKVHTSTRYLLSIGWDKWTTARGLRADEQHRLEGAAKPKERWTPWHPLADAKIAKRDVMAFWERQPFDLRLWGKRGVTPAGNCDLCFLKSEATLAGLIRDNPELVAWWEAMEAEIGATFNLRRSYRELREMVERQGDWIFDQKGALCQASDGECFA